MLPKPKIFVRYNPGASGHLMASLIYSFQKPLRLQNPISGHEHTQLLSLWNNFHLQHSNDDFIRFTKPNIDLEESINYIKTQFKFEDDQNPYQYFVTHTHVLNPDPIMFAIDNSRLVNIKTTAEDADQLAYNYVIKSLVPYSWHKLPSLFKRFQSQYPDKLKNLSIDDISKTDTKLLTYLAKFTHEKNNANRTAFQLNYDHFEIDWKDIVNKNFINKLDDLCGFLDIKLTDANRKTAANMLTQYADAQITCPWRLALDDFA